MSQNVLERLFVRLLPSAGLLNPNSSKAVDRWQTGEAQKRLLLPQKRPFHNWPVPVARRSTVIESDVDIDV